MNPLPEIVSTEEYGNWRQLCFAEEQLYLALEYLENNLSEEAFKEIAPKFFTPNGDLIRLKVTMSG